MEYQDKSIVHKVHQITVILMSNQTSKLKIIEFVKLKVEM